MTAGVKYKVEARHLARKAFLYVRQSTLQQVVENTESTRRQYDLRGRAVALGWREEQIVVIDSDLGRSGADSDREGFRLLVSEVSLGNAGIVLGMEVSRLARNNADWHRLVELCLLYDTLILDEQGIYDPSDSNDSLLLDFKGTIAAIELRSIKSRLQGGLLSKARRGELKIHLPVGYLHDPLGRIVPDPDAGVRETLATFFAVYRRSGSARAVVAYFAEHSLMFPLRSLKGPGKGRLFWKRLDHSRALQVLRNPAYAGAYAYGRSRYRRVNGKLRAVRTRLPQSEWTVLLTDHHFGYITWERYQANQAQLSRSARGFCADRRQGPPREGPALLQGIAICGKCGNRMGARYDSRRERPRYVCHRDGIANVRPICQTISGAAIDAAISELALELVAPAAIDAALGVQDEIERRHRGVVDLHERSLQRAAEEAALARRRYESVDYANRMVADVLEADWNLKLQRQAEVAAECDRQRRRGRELLEEEQRRRIRDLATDFPGVWRDPRTPPRQRKRMLRLLIEDVTLRKDDHIFLGVRLRDGAVRELTLPLPLSAWQMRRTPPAIVSLVDRLLEDRSDDDVAAALRRAGHRAYRDRPYRKQHVQNIRYAYGLASHKNRLIARGMLTSSQMAARLGKSVSAVHLLGQKGRLESCLVDGARLFWPPAEDPSGGQSQAEDRFVADSG
jgi:DNA invertase Pin-like site-specific DNA recombinase